MIDLDGTSNFPVVGASVETWASRILLAAGAVAVWLATGTTPADTAVWLADQLMLAVPR